MNRPPNKKAFLTQDTSPCDSRLTTQAWLLCNLTPDVENDLPLALDRCDETASIRRLLQQNGFDSNVKPAICRCGAVTKGFPSPEPGSQFHSRS